MPTFEIRGSWLVELRDEHGGLLLTAADRGHALWPLAWIATVRASAVAEHRFELRALPYGLAYFVALDEGDAVVATSPTFSECQHAMAYARSTIPSANVHHVSENETREPAHDLGSEVASPNQVELAKPPGGPKV
jgi:hypothetical protein